MTNAIYAIAAALAIALSTMFPALGQGKAAKAALESIARQPDAAKDIRSTLLLALALMEALTIYGLLIAFITLSRIGIMGGQAPTFAQGLLYLAACLPMGFVGLGSGIHQGKASVASINLVAKREDQFGKAMIFPAMVETYAILALLISILAIFGIK